MLISIASRLLAVLRRYLRRWITKKHQKFLNSVVWGFGGRGAVGGGEMFF